VVRQMLSDVLITGTAWRFMIDVNKGFLFVTEE
jgi:hypothetical protein